MFLFYYFSISTLPGIKSSPSYLAGMYVPLDSTLFKNLYENKAISVKRQIKAINSLGIRENKVRLFILEINKNSKNKRIVNKTIILSYFIF